MSSEAARINMKKQQLRTGHVTSDAVLDLFDVVLREAFLPEHLKPFAYSDMHIPLPHGQCMMTPLEEALLLQSLSLKGHEVVLEVGTGTGFLTALLSKQCKKVISIDLYPDFTTNARSLLNQHHCNNVDLFTGNAAQGWVASAPYDVVVFTGALSALEKMHRLQVQPSGKLFAVIGQSPVMKGMLYSFPQQGDQLHEQIVFETCIPALVDAGVQKPFVF